MDIAQKNTFDITKPNAGRIYDYLLGGTHNFEADRQAGEWLKTMAPFMPLMVRLQRWCLQDLAIEFTERRGFDVIIDFASGLPTNDHIHYVVPKGTVVIYSDRDPGTVKYALDILDGTQDVYYFEADARWPEKLLTRPEVVELLRGRRDVGLVCWGVASYLTDDEVSQTLRALYDWSGPKSCLAFNAQAADLDTEPSEAQQVFDMYKKIGSPLYFRSLERYAQLLQPWHTDEKGFISLRDWHNLENKIDQNVYSVWGPSVGGYGAYLVK